jgi:methionyl-tRNA synthetase
MLIDKYGVDAIRYFLLREVPFGLDGDFSHNALVHRINSDLANDFGNLVSRSTAMLSKYFDGKLPVPGAATELDRTLQERFAAVISQVDAYMAEMAFNRALQSIWEWSVLPINTSMTPPLGRSPKTPASRNVWAR